MTTVRRGAAVGGDWIRAGRRVVSALLVEVEGSAPFPPGATMIVDEEGRTDGSITGGCIESAVVEEALAVLRGAPPRIVTYGVSDQLAGTVGLSCGGTVHVFVHELSGAAAAVELAALEAVAAGEAVALATLLHGEGAGAKLALVGGRTVGSLGGPPLLDHSVARDTASLLDRGVTTIRRYGADGATVGADLGVHVRSFAPPPRMLIFGAIDHSVALARIAGELGFTVTICDPREAFVGSPRFAQVAEVEVAWPQDVLADTVLGPRDAVLVFSHDPKLDESALVGALGSAAGYVGALGSRRTTAERNERLLAAGVGRDDLARLHAPCGLDLGGGTPEEVAISVLAEILAARTGRGGAPLRDGTEAIHAR